MRGLYTIILLLLLCKPSKGQQGFAFTHITTDDGIGLASNLVTSPYQDEKGYILVAFFRVLHSTKKSLVKPLSLNFDRTLMQKGMGKTHVFMHAGHVIY